MTLCVCGHSSKSHLQTDATDYCMFDQGCKCEGYRKAAPEDRSLSAGVTPEGLAVETVTEPVNEAAERLRNLFNSDGRIGLREEFNAALATERRHTVVLMENEGVVTWGDDRHRARFLDEVAS